MDRKENWKPVEGFEDRYEISDQGQLRSTLPDGRVRILKGSKNGNGSGRRFSLCKDGVTSSHAIRNLVADHFLEPDESKPFVVHADGNRTNNTVDNLMRSDVDLREYERLNLPRKQYRKTWHTSPYSELDHFKV